MYSKNTLKTSWLSKVNSLFLHISKKKLENDARKEFFLKRLIYNVEGDENSQYIQAVNYSDMFLEKIVKDVNDGLLSSEIGQ